MLGLHGASLSGVATELTGASLLGRWHREMCRESAWAFQKHGRPCEVEVGQFRQE